MKGTYYHPRFIPDHQKISLPDKELMHFLKTTPSTLKLQNRQDSEKHV